MQFLISLWLHSPCAMKKIRLGKRNGETENGDEGKLMRIQINSSFAVANRSRKERSSITHFDGEQFLKRESTDTDGSGAHEGAL